MTYQTAPLLEIILNELGAKEPYSQSDSAENACCDFDSNIHVQLLLLLLMPTSKD